MHRSERFELSPEFVRRSFGQGILFAVLGAGFLAFAIYGFAVLSNPREVFFSIIIFGVSVYALKNSVVYLRLPRRSQDFAIELSEEGIADVRTGKQTPWVLVAGLRESRLSGCIWVLNRSGERAARIDCQLEGFFDVLGRVVESCTAAYPPQQLPATFRRSVPRWQGILLVAVGGLLLAVYLVLIASGHAMLAAIALAMLGVAIFVDFSTEIRSAVIAAESMSWTIGWRRSEVSFAEIRYVSFRMQTVKGSPFLRIMVTRADGSETRVSPDGADPFVLFATLRGAWSKARGR